MLSISEMGHCFEEYSRVFLKYFIPPLLTQASLAVYGALYSYVHPCRFWQWLALLLLTGHHQDRSWASSLKVHSTTPHWTSHNISFFMNLNDSNVHWLCAYFKNVDFLKVRHSFGDWRHHYKPDPDSLGEVYGFQRDTNI